MSHSVHISPCFLFARRHTVHSTKDHCQNHHFDCFFRFGWQNKAVVFIFFPSLTEFVVFLFLLPTVELGLFLLCFLAFVITVFLYGLEVMISDLVVLLLALDIAGLGMGDNIAGVMNFLPSSG